MSEENTKEVLFKDVPVNTEFFIGDVKYRKIPEERINCCKANTAVEVENPSAKAQILPLVKVKVEG